jgi:hypothetical protein
VGAFDEYSAEVACPACRDVHWIRGQTKFFDPDYDDMRSFEPGVPQPARFTAADLPGFASDGWWRLREPIGDDARFTLLADFDDLYACDCGFAFAVLLHFELAPGTVTMQAIELLDARQNLADRIDFVEADGLWQGDYDNFSRAIAALEAQPFDERAAWLRRRLDERFELTEHERDARTDDWTTLVGPTQCEACGDVRERRDLSLLTHPDHLVSFFGSAWTGGVIFLGDRIPFEDDWLADDVDRGWYFRVRHPIGDRLRLLGQQHSFGCRCGAGLARTVAHFEHRPGALELVELTLRAVSSRADLQDIDFIEGHTRQPRHPGEEPRTREFVLAWVLA